MGRSNMMRVFAYEDASSKHAIAAPSAPHEIPYRAWVRHISGLLSPPDLGRIASFGTRTSSSTSSLVSEARNESFPFWSFARKPLLLVGTTNPRIERWSLSSLVLAHTIAACAVDQLVIHIFAPLMTQEPSLVSRGMVIMPAGLEPKSGSVSPKQPMSSPDAIFGKKCRFCSSLPNA